MALTWKQTVVASMIVGASLYGGLSYARVPIPGVDIPYDEANYYSLFSVSWPDSAPSIFTLRDMGVSVNTQVFAKDFWTSWIKEDFKNHPDFYDRFIIRDNYGLLSDDDEWIYVEEGDRIKIDDSTSIAYKYFVRNFIGEDGNELAFMAKTLKWKRNDVYGLMDYIANSYGLDPEKYMKYLNQVGSGNVHDPWRKAEQEKKNENSLQWLQAKVEQYIHQVFDMKPMDQNVAQGIPKIIMDNSKPILSSQQANQILNAQKDGKLFANPLHPQSVNSDGSMPYVSETERILWADRRMRETAQFIEDSKKASQREAEIIEELIRLSSEATGNVEVQQIGNVLKGAVGNMIIHNSRVQAECNNLETIKQMQSMDQAIRSQEVNNASKFYMYDPANPTDRDKQAYERPKPIGLLEFKK